MSDNRLKAIFRKMEIRVALTEGHALSPFGQRLREPSEVNFVSYRSILTKTEDVHHHALVYNLTILMHIVALSAEAAAGRWPLSEWSWWRSKPSLSRTFVTPYFKSAEVVVLRAPLEPFLMLIDGLRIYKASPSRRPMAFL